MIADMNRIGPAELKRFAEKLDRLPPATTMRQAILGERDFFLDPLIDDLSKPGGKEKAFAQFGILDFNDPHLDPDYKAIKKMSSEQLLEGAIGVRPFYEKMAALTELPPSEFKRIKEQVEADLADPHMKETTRTIAKMILPAIVPAMQNEARHKLQLAMLKAAIAVQLQGPEALSNPAYLDPFAKAAFQYEKLDGGFRLQSKTPNPRTDKPITLEIGKGLIE